MGKEQKEELKKNGFIILELWQLVAALVTFVFACGIFYASTTATLAQHASQINKIEAWEVTHEKEQTQSVSYRNNKLTEISFNTKAICEKLGIKYQLVEGETN